MSRLPTLGFGYLGERRNGSVEGIVPPPDVAPSQSPQIREPQEAKIQSFHIFPYLE